MSVNSNIGLKYLRVCSASVSTLALSFGALPANAEPVSFNEAVARAVSTAPTIEARSLQVDAAESQLIPADQLPDPKVSVDLLDQRVAGPFEPSLRPWTRWVPTNANWLVARISQWRKTARAYGPGAK